MLNFHDPNHGTPDYNGVTWTQIGDGFDIATPRTMKLVSGVIHNPEPSNIPDKPKEHAFEVFDPGFGITVHFSYWDFEMGNSAELCVITTT
jgi:hypothetical protein